MNGTSRDSIPMPAGMYLKLFHGRRFPDEDMEDFGYDGPIIGPLKFVHTTYSSHVKIRFHDDHILTARDFGMEPDNHIILVADLFPFQGHYYGDWSVFLHEEE